MCIRLVAAVLVTLVATAHPRLQAPATTGVSNQPPVLKIIRLAVARATAQDKVKAELRFESLVETMVENGWLGRKSGEGFYDYSGDEPVGLQV